MDIQTLRSEIKAWERAYAEKHGRKPTPKEVKADPIAKKYHLYNKIKKAESAGTGPSTPKRASKSHSSLNYKPVSFSVKTPEKQIGRPGRKSVSKQPHGDVSGPSHPSLSFSKAPALSRTPQKQLQETPKAATPKPSPSVPLGPTPSIHGKVVSLLDGLDGTPVKEFATPGNISTPVKVVSILTETPTNKPASELNDEFTTPAYLNRITVDVSPFEKRLSFAERIRQSVVESPIKQMSPDKEPSPVKQTEEEFDDDEDAWRELEGLPPKPQPESKSVEAAFNGEEPDELDEIMGSVEVHNPYDEPVQNDLEWVHEVALEGESALSAPIYKEGVVKKRKHQTQKRTTKKGIVRVETDQQKKAKVDNDNFSTKNKLNTGFKVNMGQKQWSSRFKK
ncbi:DNA replication regulator SLD2 [Yarrowia sp. C11]|nr:DNA replication regulator SLD2 [Yarrowia sp. E02]KAG5372290.1 DNA replication regulator SLD2 [Yarrowia sp. C11]